MTAVAGTPAAFRAACDDARRRGLRVGLVPTMGALHEGHLSLVDAARARASFVAVTIFVNPLQFAPTDDLDRYPRTFDADLASCAARGVDVVFAPAPDAMYPPGFQTHVAVGDLTEPLEGAFRPGHFDGVTTVVAKLFNLAGPCVACFGRKDYQQQLVLRRMAYDLDLPVEVVSLPIVREPDGLARSSRNRYLSAEERTRACAIVQGLRAAWDAFDGGERDVRTLTALCRAPVDAAFDAIDYVATRDPETLAPVDRAQERAALLVAAHLGPTRLIDNVVLGEEPRP